MGIQWYVGHFIKKRAFTVCNHKGSFYTTVLLAAARYYRRIYQQQSLRMGGANTGIFSSCSFLPTRYNPP